MDKLRSTFSNREEDEESGILAEVSEATTLSRTTRIKGFFICFALGAIFSLLGTFFLMFGTVGVRLFAVFYTLGNVVGISSTCFLMGPCNQLKKMFAETRIIATCVVLLFLVLTLCSALLWHSTVLAVLFCLLQFVALIWYGLTYIPYARDVVTNCLCSVFS